MSRQTAKIAGSRDPLGLPAVLSVLLAALVSPAVPLFARADQTRPVRTARDGDYLLLSFSLSDLFDQRSEQELDSGLPTRVALRIALYREGGSMPVQASVRTCEVTYDLWDEVYRVRIRDERQDRPRDMETASRRDAIRLCTVLRNHRINVRGLQAGRFRIDVVAELNPVSPEVLEGLRSWLKGRAGADAFGSEGRSMFGSFVAIFISRRLGDADRTIRFRSEPFNL